MKVQALQSFEHGGTRRRHAEFDVSDATGQALARKGLVKIIDLAVESSARETQQNAQKLKGSARHAATPS